MMGEIDLGITWGLREGIEVADLFSGHYLIILGVTLLQFIFSIIAIIDIIKNRKFKCGNMILWIVLVLLLQLVGPVLYFTIGREEY